MWFDPVNIQYLLFDLHSGETDKVLNACSCALVGSCLFKLESVDIGLFEEKLNLCRHMHLVICKFDGECLSMSPLNYPEVKPIIDLLERLGFGEHFQQHLILFDELCPWDSPSCCRYLRWIKNHLDELLIDLQTESLDVLSQIALRQVQATQISMVSKHDSYTPKKGEEQIIEETKGKFTPVWDDAWLTSGNPWTQFINENKKVLFKLGLLVKGNLTEEQRIILKEFYHAKRGIVEEEKKSKKRKKKKKK